MKSNTLKTNREKFRALSIYPILLGLLWGVNPKSVRALTLNVFTESVNWQSEVDSNFWLTSTEDLESSTIGSLITAGVNVNGSFSNFTLTGTANDDYEVEIADDSGNNILAWEIEESIPASDNNPPELTLTFSNSVRAVAFDWSDKDPNDLYKVSFNGASTGSNSPEPPDEPHAFSTDNSCCESGFYGVVATDDTIESITMTWDGTNPPTGLQLDRFAIDDIRVATASEVPFDFSPTVGLLMVGGVMGLHRLQKRRCDRQSS